MTDIQTSFAQSRNFAGIEPPFSNYDFARVVILPVPYDGTVEWHNGSRYGPRSIIDASAYLEWYDLDLNTEIYKMGIHTHTELQPSFAGPEETLHIIRSSINRLLNDLKFIVMLGGEHSITIGAVQEFTQHFKDITVLQLDAHTDLRNEYTGTQYSHACVMRRVVELCPVVQVGIRSLSLEESALVNTKGINTFFYKENSFDELTRNEIINCLSDNVYISIDLDVFDPSIMSAVGTPEPGGMRWQEVIDLLRVVTEVKNVVGFDIVELCPPQGTDSCSYLAAKLAYKLIGYALIKG